LIVVRDALGHSEIGTTSGYSHAANDDVRAAVDGLALAIAGPR
jgi:site-specific recombinase XerD